MRAPEVESFELFVSIVVGNGWQDDQATVDGEGFQFDAESGTFFVGKCGADLGPAGVDHWAGTASGVHEPRSLCKSTPALSVISLSRRPSGTSLSAYKSLIGNLYYGVRARRAHVFAWLEGLVGKSLTLGGAHPGDRGLFIVVG